ncbi:MAG TPA: DUF1698 domain-containing protein, partial [Gemmatimonadales bacterium]|nr:DUF1698 domain-containing protein [Gemmatimonadales bacterium]
MSSVWNPRPPDSAPPAFGETLFAGIAWHHRWEIFRGVFTPGPNPVALLCEHIQLPRDLRGRRVLDIGAWNGCFSFECERRGAAEVVAFGPEDPEAAGFNRLRDALGSSVKYHRGSIYDIDARTVGTFDVVLFLGVLYHLRYPLLALDKLRRLTTGVLLVESHVIDDGLIPPNRSRLRSFLLRRASRTLANVPLWQFYRHGELGGDPSNWFGPNVRAVLDGLGSAGFDAAVLGVWSGRAAFRATP